MRRATADLVNWGVAALPQLGHRAGRIAQPELRHLTQPRSSWSRSSLAIASRCDVRRRSPGQVGAIAVGEPVGRLASGADHLSLLEREHRVVRADVSEHVMHPSRDLRYATGVACTLGGANRDPISGSRLASANAPSGSEVRISRCAGRRGGDTSRPPRTLPAGRRPGSRRGSAAAPASRQGVSAVDRTPASCSSCSVVPPANPQPQPGFGAGNGARES